MTSQHETDLIHLTRSIELADEAVREGNHPFGSVLVSAEGKVLELLAPMQPGLLITALEPQQPLTPYVRWGERPLWLLLMATVIVRVSQREAGSGRPPAPVHRRKTRPPGLE